MIRIHHDAVTVTACTNESRTRGENMYKQAKITKAPIGDYDLATLVDSNVFHVDKL